MEWRSDAKYFEGLGGGSRRILKGSGSRLLSDQDLSLIYTDTRYRFARILVDRPAEDCTRRGWKITIADASDGIDPFADELKRLQVKKKFRLAHEKARIYGGAGIVMILDDDGELHEPIRGRVRGVRALHVFARSELIPATWATDIRDPLFGMPSSYFLHPTRARAAGAHGWGDIVHADRVIRFEGLPIPDSAVYSHDGWGQSVIEACFQEIADINVATDAVREAIDQFQYNVLKLANLKKYLTGNDGNLAEFRARLQAINEGKETTRLIVLDKDDDYQTILANFTGLIEAYQVAQQNLCAVARIPVTLFFGQSPSGLSTDDQSGTRNYYDGISAMQEEYYQPPLERLVSLLAEAGHGPDEGWQVEFLGLLRPSEMEEAQTKKIHAETDAINIDRGIYGPEEARRRYTAAGFSSDIVLSADDDAESSYQRLLSIMNEAAGGGAESQDPRPPEDQPITS